MLESVFQRFSQQRSIQCVGCSFVIVNFVSKDCNCWSFFNHLKDFFKADNEISISVSVFIVVFVCHLSVITFSGIWAKHYVINNFHQFGVVFSSHFASGSPFIIWNNFYRIFFYSAGVQQSISLQLVYFATERSFLLRIGNEFNFYERLIKQLFRLRLSFYISQFSFQ